jgi:bla regulator protein BlaR1
MTQTLLQAGLVNAILATLLAVVVAGLARLCRARPALVHGLWLLVLLKLMTPPLIPLPLPWPTPAEEVVAVKVGEPSEPACPCVLLDRTEPVGIDVARIEKSALADEPEFEASAPAASLRSWLPELIVGLWLSGTVCFWTLAATRLARLRRVLRELPNVPDEIQLRIEALARRLGLRQNPRGHLVPGVLPPMLLAVGRVPRLLLPATLWARLDALQRDTLLLHELAHLRRGDHRVRWLELVVCGLYWWHPVAWWACRALRDAEEECCDAWVVWAAPEAGPAYASTLVETIAFLSGSTDVLPAGASGAGPVRLIKRRLTMILQGRTSRSLSRSGLTVVLVLGLALLPLAPTLAQPGPAAQLPASAQRMPASERFFDDLRSCQSCHGTPHGSVKKEVVVDKAHDEVVRLMDAVKLRRKQLLDAESALKAALRRFDAQQAAKKPVHQLPRNEVYPSDRRLQDVEKKLELLLKEVEKLRKELRPAKREEAMLKNPNER